MESKKFVPQEESDPADHLLDVEALYLDGSCSSIRIQRASGGVLLWEWKTEGFNSVIGIVFGAETTAENAWKRKTLIHICAEQ